MRTIRTKVYQFSELSEQAKENAVSKLWDINLDYYWWNSVYDDAENVGIKITGFDTDRGNYCEAEFIDGAYETATKILSEHGEMCETYKTAANYLKEYAELVSKYSDGVNTNLVAEGNEWDFDNEADELEEEFLKSLSEDYLQILRDEYEYQTSEDAIISTIKANEYEFTKDGNRF